MRRRKNRFGLFFLISEMGVSPSTYSKWERHITTVKLGDLARILNVLEVSPEQVKLFLNEEDPEGEYEED